MAGNSADYIITPELVENVQEAGREILATGHNPIFVRERGSGDTRWEVCAAMIEEAKKIVRMGYNAKIGCASVETDISDREKRREYYRWKRMNRS